MDSSVDKKSEGDPSSDSDPHPKPDPNPESGALGSAPSIVPKSQKSVRWNPDLTTEVKPHDSSPGSRIAWVANRIGMMRDVVGRWRQRAGEASKTAESLAGNVWQHLKTGPSFTDVAMGRLAQGTKILAEGGYEKIFRQNFDTFSEEQLLKTYACYLSTSAGPVMGILYLSTAKLAFCSDSPLPYKVGDQTEWSYYKVMIPLHQLKAVNPSASNVNPAEKYIQAISVDNHEFWFMGFVNYDGAVINLQDALRIHALQA